ncbi:uncharacterized protein LOC124809991 isoform X1 [Hydra vulgaris]|uniref:uncharacterized protein LOC124809991 isoform X1 n=1 Tax=Hydra vulgaris TaxID=6087 RepID=UPI001F5F010E|nr:uncharacterized protein LOC124809991 [Hydra vulgaris]
MNYRLVLVYLVFCLSFITLTLLNASLLCNNQWSNLIESKNGDKDVSLFIKHFNTDYKAEFDAPWILCIFSRISYWCFFIMVLIFVFNSHIMWIFSLTLLFMIITCVLLAVFSIAVHLRIHRDIESALGTSFVNKDISLYITYWALIPGLLSLLLAFIFMASSFVQPGAIKPKDNCDLSEVSVLHDKKKIQDLLI